MHRRTILQAFVLAILIYSISLPTYRILQAQGYSVIVEDSVDADSNYNDGHIGTNSSDYTNAQTKDGTYQTLTEEEVGAATESDTNHFVNGTSDSQTPSDVGTYSKFGHMKDENDTYNTLTEGQGSGYVAQVNVSDTFDSYTTDIDSYPDVGTDASHSNAQATTNDGSYMTMQEANQGGGGGATEYLAEAFTDVGGDFASESNAYDGDWGTSSVNTDYSTADDYPSAYASSFDSANSGTGTITQVDIIVRMSYASSSASDEWGITLDVGASTGNVLYAMTPNAYSLNNNTFTDVTEPNGGGWAWSEVWAIEVHIDGEKVGGADNDEMNIYEFAVRVTTSAADDYELDLEYQFTTVDNDNTYEYLCTYVQTATVNGDQLKAWEWTGTTWASLGTLSSDGWNNFTLTYLTSATYYVKFNDSDQNNEGTSSTFNMDCIFLRTSSNAINDYEFDREFYFDNLVTTSIYEELCINTGTIGDEALQLYVWHSATWTLLSDDIQPADDNTWINISITDYLDSAIENFSFRDNNQANEGTQSTWQIDAVLIHHWNSTEAWLSGWSYRKNHTINALTGAGTNYQIALNISTMAGTDSGDNVYLNGKCRDDMGDIRFTDNDATTELDYWFYPATLQVMDDVKSLWGMKPLAWRYSSTYDRTYFTYLNTSAQKPFVQYWDHGWDNFSDPVLVGNTVGTTDGHASPTMCINSSGYILIFHGGEEYDTDLYLTISSNAEDITAWESTQTLATAYNEDAYHSPVVLSNGSIFLFIRNEISVNNYEWRYSKSNDGGTSWGSWIQFLYDSGINDRPYLIIQPEGNDMLVAMTQYEEDDNDDMDLYYIRYNHSSTQWEDTANSAKTLPLALSEFETLDLAKNTMAYEVEEYNEEIYILYEADLEYIVAKYNGSWNYLNVTSNGYTDCFRQGGAMHVTDNDNIELYLPIENNSYNEIYRYITSDGGDTWTNDLNVTEDSSVYHRFPMIPINFDNEVKLVFLAGLTGGPGSWNVDHSPVYFNDITDDTDWIGHGIRADTIFWVKVADDLSSSSVDICIYYGNPSATTTMNGTATFIFFDDFSGGSLDTDKWTLQQGDVGISNGKLVLTSTSGDRGSIDSKINVTVGVAIHSYAKADQASTENFHYCRAWSKDRSDNYGLTSTLSGYNRFTSRNDDSQSNTDLDGGGGTYVFPNSEMDDAWKSYMVTWNSTDCAAYKDGEFMVIHTDPSENIPDAELQVMFYEGNNDPGNEILRVDHVFARKWVDPDVTHGAWTSEENAPAGGSTYKLLWAHRCNDVDADKNIYNLTVYAYSNSGTEDFAIEIWNVTASLWDLVDTTNISTTETWYNYTLAKTHHLNTTDDTITWRYIGTLETGDSSATELRIDYAGVTAWNFTIELITQTHVDFGAYSAGSTQQAGNQTAKVNVTAGETFDIQVKGTDSTNTVVTDGYIYVNTENNWNTAMLLNTTYDTLWSDQTVGIDQQFDLYFWIYINWSPGDAAIPNGAFEFEINIKIIES